MMDALAKGPFVLHHLVAANIVDDSAIMRRFHAGRVAVGLIAGMACLAMAAHQSDVSLAVVGTVLLATAGYAAICMLRTPPGVAVALVLDAMLLVVGVAVLRPPPGVLVGPVLYLTLAAVLLMRRPLPFVLVSAGSAAAALGVGAMHWRLGPGRSRRRWPC
jgi:hypothetical protein